MLKRLSIPLKLRLLAGVPVIGALVLATLIVLGAQRQAAGAAALGDVDALAKLAARMANVVHEAGSKLKRNGPPRAKPRSETSAC